MKTVKLNNQTSAIPIRIEFYVNKARMQYIVTDLIFYERITFDSSKNEILKSVRNHLFQQGVSTYSDWYEDTDDTPIINEIYEKVKPWIEELFPEIT